MSRDNVNLPYFLKYKFWFVQLLIDHAKLDAALLRLELLISEHETLGIHAPHLAHLKDRLIGAITGRYGHFMPQDSHKEKLLGTAEPKDNYKSLQKSKNQSLLEENQTFDLDQKIIDHEHDYQKTINLEVPETNAQGDQNGYNETNFIQSDAHAGQGQDGAHIDADYSHKDQTCYNHPHGQDINARYEEENEYQDGAYYDQYESHPQVYDDPVYQQEGYVEHHDQKYDEYDNQAYNKQEAYNELYDQTYAEQAYHENQDPAHHDQAYHDEAFNENQDPNYNDQTYNENNDQLYKENYDQTYYDQAYNENQNQEYDQHYGQAYNDQAYYDETYNHQAYNENQDHSYDETYDQACHEYNENQNQEYDQRYEQEYNDPAYYDETYNNQAYHENQDQALTGHYDETRNSHDQKYNQSHPNPNDEQIMNLNVENEGDNAFTDPNSAIGLSNAKEKYSGYV